ncbi:hypothetical protein CALVIDRAFT_569062 [Calocera viscosa TUFC12733]|uniref:Uncharacterized protein n=1 Tax=Calocera viscosa (strain TUFC12733) TaxID=1330018 RepID=A0A167GCM7_CALVF|nr:hypothetical protein CALVIDRAFT_569062 [Calocera viscosa TUFC12733]
MSTSTQSFSSSLLLLPAQQRCQRALHILAQLHLAPFNSALASEFAQLNILFGEEERALRDKHEFQYQQLKDLTASSGIDGLPALLRRHTELFLQQEQDLNRLFLQWDQDLIPLEAQLQRYT